MRVCFDSRPGSAAKPNEDFAAAGPRVALILDGLSAPPELGMGCTHGTPWYVAELGARLLHGAGTRPTDPLPDIVADAIAAVAALHADSCDLTHPGTPSSSVALLRVGAETVDFLSVFDSVIVLDGPGGLTVRTDLRVDSYAQEEHQATTRYQIGTPEHQQAVSRLVAAQRPWRNRPEGYWVAAAIPRTAQEAVTGSVPRSAVTRAAILSDGASCLVDKYAAMDWPQLLDLLEQGGPGEVIARVRAAEDEDPLGKRWPRYKRSDDSTVVFCGLDPEG